jgi:hypothetical protein
MAILLVAALASPAAADDEVVVIVHPTNSVSALSLRDLTRIYKFHRTRWAEGTGITPLLPPRDTPENQRLLEAVFRLQSDAAVARYYLRAVFDQRIAGQPVRCLDTTDAVRRVADEPGAIALVRRSALPEAAPVRVLGVDGL